MSRFIMLLFFTMFIVSCAQVKTNEDGYVFVKGEGNTVFAALAMSVCEYSLLPESSKGFVESYGADGKKYEKEIVDYVEGGNSANLLSSSYGYRKDDVLIKPLCLKRTVVACEDAADCLDNEKIKSVESMHYLIIKTNDVSYDERMYKKLVSDSKGLVLSDKLIKTSFIEKYYNCDVKCFNSLFEEIGFTVIDSSFNGGDTASVMLTMRVDEEKIKNSYVNEVDFNKNRNLWRKFKSQKSQDELAEEISKMEVDADKESPSNKKTIFDKNVYKYYSFKDLKKQYDMLGEDDDGYKISWNDYMGHNYISGLKDHLRKIKERELKIQADKKFKSELKTSLKNERAMWQQFKANKTNEKTNDTKLMKQSDKEVDNEALIRMRNERAFWQQFKATSTDEKTKN